MIYLGILTYKNCDLRYASNNIGDYIQSLAALNIYRKCLEDYYRTSYEIEEFLQRVIDNSFDDFHFVFINRDSFKEIEQSSRYRDVSIVVILNGWWMRTNGRETSVFDFPFPKNICPILVSFHVADSRMLTSAGIEYLKKHGPVGCRDTYTKHLLEEHGVCAYFSGCLTKSIDFYHHTPPDKGKRTYIVDVDMSVSTDDKVIHVNHSEGNHVNADGGYMLKRALSLLKNYSQATKVYTTRLHCYMPCLAMGVPVELRSPDGSNGERKWGRNPRFQGLLFQVKDLDQPAGEVALDSLKNFILQ